MNAVTLSSSELEVSLPEIEQYLTDSSLRVFNLT
jgi:hypothetical protein